MRNPFNPDHYDPEKTDEHKAIHNALRCLVKAEKYSEDWPKTKEAVNAAINVLINECPNNECCVCGVICCPEGDEMHFHHDGCPSCAEPISPDYPVTSTPDPQADQPSRA